MQSSLFVSWLPGMWVFVLALANSNPPPAQQKTTKTLRPYHLPLVFYTFCLSCSVVPLFRTTAATAALQLQFSRICLKQIYMEGSVRAEFINAAPEELFSSYFPCHH